MWLIEMNLVLSAILKPELHCHPLCTLQIKQIVNLTCIDQILAVYLHSARQPCIRIAMTKHAA